MKSGIFVCLLAVLAYYEAACYSGPAQLNGNCNLEDYDQGLLNQCVSITCNRFGDRVEQMLSDCAEINCPNGYLSGPHEPDLSKTYPACCNYKECN